jgi:hypothetical protein
MWGALLAFCLLISSEGRAFVHQEVGGVLAFWPTAQATVNLQLGCPSSGPLLYWGPCWNDAAIDAAIQWNNSTTRFRFVFQSPSPSVSPCDLDGINTVAFRSTLCGFTFDDALAVTFLLADSQDEALVETDTLFNALRSWSTYPGPLQVNSFGETIYDFHRVAIHELGHVLGLDHPDDFGQSVSAIMNRRVSGIDTLQPDDIAGVNAIYASTTPPPPPQGALENPPSGGFMSGIYNISGWVCAAGRVDLLIDGIPIRAIYGNPRADTSSMCGDDNNGFVLLINWNNLSNGNHTIVALADGVEFDRSTFTTTNLGQEFLRGASGRFTIPFNGRNVTIEWQESSQNFIIVGVQ